MSSSAPGSSVCTCRPRVYAPLITIITVSGASHFVASPKTSEPEGPVLSPPHSPNDGPVLQPSIRKRATFHESDPVRDVGPRRPPPLRKSRLGTMLQPEKKIGPAPGIIQSLKAVLLASCTGPVFRNSITLKRILSTQGSIFYFSAFQSRLVVVRSGDFSFFDCYIVGSTFFAQRGK